MAQKRIENKFQSALKDYSSSIDDDQLWLEIESFVPKKKKKNRLFIWLYFGFSIMTMVLLLIWMTSIWKTPESNGSKIDTSIKKDVIISENTIVQNSIVAQSPESDSKSQKLNLVNNINNKSNQKSNNNRDLKDYNLKHLIIFNQQVSNDETKENLNEFDIRNQKFRKELNVPRVNTLFFKDRLFLTNSEIEIKLKIKQQKKDKPKKATKKSRPSIVLNYYAGKMYSKTNRSSQDEKFIDFGNDYFSQGLSFSYNQFVSSKLYGKIIFSADKSYKKYSDQVVRDTLVPSSQGSQILSYTAFVNGVIDTESGIPIVKGEYKRDVLHLNTMTSIAAGIGIGYQQSIGNWNINLEADVQKSFYYTLSGLGKQESEENIRNLNQFENYFSYDSKYTVNSQLNLDLAIRKTVRVTAGLQYQLGFSSILIEQTKHSEKINLLRASIGLKKEL